MAPIAIAMGLAQFAPQVIRWLSGSEKAGEAANTVVAMAEAITGKVGPDALTAVVADPALQLRFQEAVLAAEAELDKAYLVDRQDARKRDVELAKVGAKNYRPDVLIFLAFLGCIGVVALLASGMIDGSQAIGGFLIALGTRFVGMIGTAFDFEFGSSRGSKEKDEKLAQKGY
jgi:hypothetical protein